MSRAERLAVLAQQLEALELQVAQAHLDAGLNLGGWTEGDKAWLERAQMRVGQLSCFVAVLRQPRPAPVARATQEGSAAPQVSP